MFSKVRYYVVKLAPCLAKYGLCSEGLALCLAKYGLCSEGLAPCLAKYMVSQSCLAT